jgi:hypothetical protein
VIDSQETGKHLLKNGGLKRRVTFIPLDKIQVRFRLLIPRVKISNSGSSRGLEPPKARAETYRHS